MPSVYSRTEHHCRLPCQTSAKNLSLNSIAICAIMVQTLCQDHVALYVSRCCADIERNMSKKWDFFLQETMPCTHGPSLYVWMSAVVGAVLIAYDYECVKEQSASLFLGSQKQAFLASWLWALTVYILYILYNCIFICLLKYLWNMICTWTIQPRCQMHGMKATF